MKCNSESGQLVIQKILRWCVPVLTFLLAGNPAYAVTKAFVGSGNWSNASNWSPSGVPASSDDVTIPSGFSVTVDGNYSCNVLKMGTISADDASVLITNSSNSLTINGDLQLNSKDKNKIYILDAGPGSIYVNGTFSHWGTAGTNTIRVGSGSVTFSPAVSISNNSQFITFTGAGTVNFNSTFTDSYNGLTTFTGCTVNFASSYTVNTTAINWSGKGTAHFANGSSINPASNLTLNHITINSSASVSLNSDAGTVIVGGDFILSSGSAFTVNKSFEVDGNWTNNGGSVTWGSNTLTLNGLAKTIGGTSSTTFATLIIGRNGGANAVTYSMDKNITTTYLNIDGSGYNRTLNLSSGTTLTVSQDLTISQPTVNSITSALMVNSGTCNINRHLVFSGTNNTSTRVAKAAVTSGSMFIDGTIVWMSNSETATEVVTVSTGTITFGSSLTMGSNSGTLSVTDAGTINFNGTSVPSFTFGGSLVSPVFSTAPGSTLNFKAGFTNNTNALTLASASNSVFTGNGTVTPNASITFGNLTINSGYTLTLAGNISLKGNWNNSGTFTPATYTVTFNALSPNTQTITKSGGETFYGLGASNSGATLTLINDVTVTNSLTMGGANINLNTNTLTVGNSTGASLSRTGGIVYGGIWKRWLPASAITSNSGFYYGLFPVGVPGDYRPVEINSTSSPSVAGYVMATHFDTISVTFVTYTDNEGDDIEDIADITSTLTTSGLDGGTYDIDVTFTGLTNKGVTSDMKLLTYTGGTMGSVGNSVTTAGTVVNPTVKRTNISASQLANVWVIGSKNKTITPLRDFYYSRKSGNWNDVTEGNGTWSRISGGSGPSCDCYPSDGGCVVINDGHTVTVNINSAIDYVDINSGGTLSGNSGVTLTLYRDFITYGSGSFNNAGTWTLNRLLTLSSSTLSSSSGNLTVYGNFMLPSGGTYTQSTGIFTASADVTLFGNFSVGSATANLIGNGSAIAGTGNFTTSGGGTLNVAGNKIINTGSNITIGNGSNPLQLALADSITVANHGTTKVYGSITGGNATTWLNEANSTLDVTENLLTSGILDASSNGNSIIYSGSGNQTIKIPASSYFKLVISNAGTKTLEGNVSASNEVRIEDAAILDESTYTLSGSASLTMNGTSELKLERGSNGTYPELTGTYSLTGGTVTINQTSDTATIKDAVYYNLKFIGTQPHNVSGVSALTNNFQIQNSSTIFNAFGLNVGNNFDYSSNGTSTLDGDLTVGGFTISSGGLNDGGNTITVNGSTGWNNNGGTFTTTGTVIFTGNSTQQISGSQPTVFHSLTVNNPAGVTLNVNPSASTDITGSLVLTSGVLTSTSSNLLRILHGAVSESGSSASYISGPVMKIGNTPFVFPIGKSGLWKRAEISGMIDSTTAVTAEYFDVAYTNLTPISDSLTQVSDVEYWDINRTVTSDGVKIKLFWQNATSSDITDCNYLTIAHRKGSMWEREDATVADGSSCTSGGSGSIETDNMITAFSPFTFGGSGGTALPVTLVSFDASPAGSKVRTNWHTSLEVNNHYFTVERSIDGVNFSEISRVSAAGNSTVERAYETFDENPLRGTSYYRLKQTDFDGHFTYSGMIPVNFNLQSSITVHSNPSSHEMLLNVSGYYGNIELTIFDLLGKKVFSEIIQSLGRSTHVVAVPKSVYSGMYLLTANSNGIYLKEKILITQ